MEGTPHPRGKTGWRWEIPGHKPSLIARLLWASPLRGPHATLAATTLPRRKYLLSAQTALWCLEQDSRVGDRRPGGICGRGCRPESPGQSIWEVFLVFFLPLRVWDLSSWTRNLTPRPLQWKHGVLTTGRQGSPNIWEFLRELGPSREGGNKGQPLGSCWSPGTCRIQASPASPSLCLLLRRAP